MQKEGDGRVVKAAQKGANSYAWWREVEHRVAWTIHGDSFIILYDNLALRVQYTEIICPLSHSTRGDKEKMKTPLDRFLDFLVSRLIGMFLEQESSKVSGAPARVYFKILTSLPLIALRRIHL